MMLKWQYRSTPINTHFIRSSSSKVGLYYHHFTTLAYIISQTFDMSTISYTYVINDTVSVHVTVDYYRIKCNKYKCVLISNNEYQDYIQFLIQRLESICVCVYSRPLAPAGPNLKASAQYFT